MYSKVLSYIVIHRHVFVFEGAERNHLKVRDSVVDHMAGACSHKLARYLGSNTKEHIVSNHMDKNGSWATEAEILATANLLGMDICVWSSYGRNFSWLRYPASFDINIHSHCSLLIRNVNNVHFDAVLATK